MSNKLGIYDHANNISVKGQFESWIDREKSGIFY